MAGNYNIFFISEVPLYTREELLVINDTIQNSNMKQSEPEKFGADGANKKSKVSVVPWIELKSCLKKFEKFIFDANNDFFNYDNPFLDNIDIKDLVVGEIEFHKNDDGLIDKKVFSDDEMNFITKEIIPRFDLEEKIVDSVIKWMKNKSEVNAIQLDTPIEKTVLDWVKKNKSAAEEEGIGLRDLIGSYRHATMSRLAEIGKVTWVMKPKKLKDGTNAFPESFYSINK